MKLRATVVCNSRVVGLLYTQNNAWPLSVVITYRENLDTWFDLQNFINSTPFQLEINKKSCRNLVFTVKFWDKLDEHWF